MKIITNSAKAKLKIPKKSFVQISYSAEPDEYNSSVVCEKCDFEELFLFYFKVPISLLKYGKASASDQSFMLVCSECLQKKMSKNPGKFIEIQRQQIRFKPEIICYRRFDLKKVRNEMDQLKL